MRHRWCMVGTGSEVHVCASMPQPKHWRSCGNPQPASCRCRRGTASKQQTGRVQAHPCFPAGVPVLSVEAAVTFGWAQATPTASIGNRSIRCRAHLAALVLDKLGINVDQRRRPSRPRSFTPSNPSNNQEPTSWIVSSQLATDFGAEPVARQPKARLHHIRSVAGARRSRRARPDLEPHHLPEGDPGFARLRRAVQRARRHRHELDPRRLLGDGVAGHQQRPRHPRSGVRGHRRSRWLRERRGRPWVGPRRSRHRVRRSGPPPACQPPQPDGQDPGRPRTDSPRSRP